MFLCLSASLTSPPCLSAPLTSLLHSSSSPPPSILVDMLQLKVAPDECSFETNRAGGRIQEGFFICMWISCKASNLHHRAGPSTASDYTPTAVWWLAGIVFLFFFFFLPSISSPAPQSPSTDGVPVIINNLGEDALRRWGQGGGGRKSERMGEEMRRVTESVHPSLQHLSCLLALQSLLCTCATSNAPGYQPKRGGIFHVVSIFVYFFSSQRGPLWGCSRPVMWRIWSWDAWGLRVGDGP